MNVILNVLVVIGCIIAICLHAPLLNAATTELIAIKEGVLVLAWVVFLGVSIITITIDNKDK